MKLNRIALAIVLAAPLAASAQTGLLSVTPLLGYHTPDKGDSGAYVGLAAGLRIVPSVAIEAEYGKTSDAKLLNANVLISPESWATSTLSPYVLAGFGQQDLDYNVGLVKTSTTDTVMNLGYGVIYALSDVLSLRGELRAIHNSDQSLTDYLVLTGLQYGFGGKAEEAPYVAPEEPVNVVVADTDGDGVVDANDRCPNTPAGWEVSVDGCPLDGDKDRVPNSIDECPNTPSGMQVGANGCPLDEDKDGVTDSQDKCPGTTVNVIVDDKGCAKTVDSVVKDKVVSKINVVFDVNKAIIKPEFESEVAKIADLAKQYPTSFITIEGHTDSSGVPAKNLALSKQRAEAVRSMLVSKFGIEDNRLMAVGFGQTQPLAANASVEGKSLNRRVVAVLTGERTTIEKKQMMKPAKAVKGKKAVKKGKKAAAKKKVN